MSVTVIQKCRICDTFSCDNSPVYFCKTCRLDLCERCISAHLRFFILHDVVRYRDKHTTNTAIPLCSIHSLRCEFFCRDCKAYVCWKTSHLHKFHRTIDFIEKLNRLHAQTALLYYKIMPVYSRMFSRLQCNFWQNATLFETVRKHISNCHLHSCEDDQESDCKICATILKANLMEKQFLSKLKKQITELARKQVFISKIVSRNIRVLGNLEALRDLRSLSLKDIGKGLDFTYIDLQYPLVSPTEMIANEEGGVSLICDTPLELPLSKIFEDRKFTMLSTSIHHKRLSGVACTSGDFAWICGPDHATFYKVNKKGIILIRISININPIYICANERTIFYSDYTDNSIKLHYIEDDDFYIFGENASVEKTIYTNDRHWCPMALTNSRTLPKNCVILVCEFNLYIGHGRVCRYNTDEDGILQIVEYVDDYNTIPLYSSVWSITENINGDIWVVDGNKYAVVVVDEPGRLLNVYKGQPNDQSFHPWGITHNILGQVFISDHYNFKIHVLDQRGHFARFLYLHYDDLPTGVSCGPDNKLWVVGDFGKVNIFVYM